MTVEQTVMSSHLLLVRGVLQIEKWEVQRCIVWKQWFYSAGLGGGGGEVRYSVWRWPWAWC